MRYDKTVLGFVVVVGCGSSGVVAAGMDASTTLDASGRDALATDAGALDGGVEASDATMASDATADGGPDGPVSGYIEYSPGNVFAIFMNGDPVPQDYPLFQCGGSQDGVPCLRQECTKNVINASCFVQTCSNAYVDAGDVLRLAGTMTFTDVDGGGLSLDASSYQYIAALNLGYAPGQALSAAASGGSIPSFGPESVVNPGNVILVDPNPLEQLTVSLAQPLNVTWTGGSVGSNVVIRVTGNGGYVNCTFDAVTGTGTVPAQALSSVPGLGGLEWFQVNTSRFMVGTFLIEVLADSLGYVAIDRTCSGACDAGTD